MIFNEVDGTQVPALGLGTWKLWGSECVRIVTGALDVGYRHIDSAQRYENEEDVGRGISGSRIPREEIFLTTKLDIGNAAPEAVHRTTRESLRRLGVDYVDLLMIHWPEPDSDIDSTLSAMAELQQAGLVRHLGVCNFPPSLFARATRITRIVTNQVEYHPYLSQATLLDLCRNQRMFLTAFAPLARGAMLEEPTIVEVADSHGRTPAQVTLRWLLQQGDVAAIPKTASIERARSNFGIFDFKLDQLEMDRITALAREGGRLLNPPHAPAWED